MSAQQFGDFTFDSTARRLTQKGAEVHMPGKAIDLLTLLMAHQPEAVAKTEIHAHLWPDTYVSEVSLTTLIYELRSALGESARRQRYVRTVHGYGYAFRSDA